MASFDNFDATSPVWQDVRPVAQDDGPAPLCPILYSPEYSQAMDLLRAIMPTGELSPRALALTSHLARLNPSSYTVWAYRARVLGAPDEDTPAPKGLGKRDDRLREEMEWLGDVSGGMSMKNYQVWQHRRTILCLQSQPDITGELAFTEKVLGDDAKNYHTWAHRAWLLCTFDGLATSSATSASATAAVSQVKAGSLWEAELPWTTRLIEEDARNNSAWNHRWLVVFGSGRAKSSAGVPGLGASLEECVKAESQFTESHIAKMPHNASAWSYLRGVVSLSGSSNPYAAHVAFAQDLLSRPASIPGPPECPAALEWLLDDAEARQATEEAKALIRRLMTAEPMRKRYWHFRASAFAKSNVAPLDKQFESVGITA